MSPTLPSALGRSRLRSWIATLPVVPIPVDLIYVATTAPAAENPKSVRGRVILDANANGRIDAGEKGLAGIAVTDGVNFVTTGDDGNSPTTTSRRWPRWSITTITSGRNAGPPPINRPSTA